MLFKPKYPQVMSDSGNWCLIESDPGLFTELIKGFGVEGLECCEIYDLNDTTSIVDALGFIFLYKWEGKEENPGKPVQDDRIKSIFFAEQVIKNACATQAIINILLNIPATAINLGDTLNDLKNFASDFDSQMKGSALTNCDQIRSVHNSFSPPHVFELEEKKYSKSEDVYHFVGYVPIDGKVYELDGLKSFPLDQGPIPEGSCWIDVIKPLLMNRMAACMDGRFNLMAIVPSRLKLYEKQLAEMSPTTVPHAEVALQLKKYIEIEKKKLAVQRTENIRRRHNYLPFIIELLKVLAENDRLVDVVKKAKEMSKPVSERAATKA